MFHLFMKGGPLMWPLLLASLVALTTVLEQAITLYRDRKRRRPTDIRTVLQEMRDGDLQGALETGEVSPDFRARALGTSLSDSKIPFGTAFSLRAAQELRRMSKGQTVLDTIITLAPLLGLLGTVTGMIHAFGLMGASELDAPTAITGGIAEALIATAFGLGIAIVSLIPFNWQNGRIEKAQQELQELGSQAEALVLSATLPLNAPSTTKTSRVEAAYSSRS